MSSAWKSDGRSREKREGGAQAKPGFPSSSSSSAGRILGGGATRWLSFTLPQGQFLGGRPRGRRSPFAGGGGRGGSGMGGGQRTAGEVGELWLMGKHRKPFLSSSSSSLFFP